VERTVWSGSGPPGEPADRLPDDQRLQHFGPDLIDAGLGDFEAK